MNRILKRAARALLTAGVLGVLPSASAQEVVLPPLGSIPTSENQSSPHHSQLSPPAVLAVPPVIVVVPPIPANDEFIIPKVVTPAFPQSTMDRPPIPLPRPSRDAQTAPSARMITKPRIAVFAADQTGPTVNLLAVPTIPSSWAVDATAAPAPAPQRSSDVIVVTVPAPAVPRPVESTGTRQSAATETRRIPSLAPPLTVEITPLPQSTAAPASIPPAVFPATVHPASRQTSATWAERRATVAVKPNTWPTAFVEHDRTAAPTQEQTTVKENESVVSPISKPIIPALLQQQVARVCGGLATDVKVTLQPDHLIAVQVHPVNQTVERELRDRLLKVPELMAPNVWLEVEMLP